MTYLLGINIGTTRIQAALFNELGRVINIAEYECTLNITNTNYVEIDVNDYWLACINAIRTILNASKIKPSNIAAIAVSSHGETLVPLDKEGKPLRKAIVWLDKRSLKECRLIRKEFEADLIFKVTGQPDVIPVWPATKILWIKNNEKKIFEKTNKFLFIEDYINYKLSGSFITEYSISSSSLLFDIQKEQWWPEMLKFLGLDETQLSELKPSGSYIGNITYEASKETGLNIKTEVATGAFNQAAAAIGAGGIKPGMITERTEDALAIVAPIEKPIYDPMRKIPCHHHAINKAYFLLPWSSTAGMALRWFRDEFLKSEKDVANAINMNPYKLLELEAERVPAGSHGLIFLPYLMGAECPEFDPSAKGVMFGITLRHTKAHFIRAIMESVAYMLRRNIELLEGLGIKVDKIISIGKGAENPLWMQIKSDVTNKVILSPRFKQTASLGAAILASVAAKKFNTIEEACKSMVHIKDNFIPNPKNWKVYDKLYKIYLNLYDNLKGLFPLVTI